MKQSATDPAVRRGALMIAAGLVLAVPLLGTATARADEPTLVFSGSGYSFALLVEAGNPRVVPLLPGGAVGVTSPTARAVAGASGNGRGLASLAYPGSFVATVGPGAVTGSLPLPPGSNPTAGIDSQPVTLEHDGAEPGTRTKSGPGFSLTIDAAPQQATTTARGGVASTAADAVPDFFLATARAFPAKGGGITTVSTARITAAEAPGLLQLGTITAMATATRAADGALTRSSTFVMKGASLAGLELRVDDGVLVVDVAGTAMPLEDALTTIAALAPVEEAGIRLRFAPATETADGVVAPHLDVTIPAQLPAIPLPAVDLPAPIVVPGLPVAVTGIGPIPPSTTSVTTRYGYAVAEAAVTRIPALPALDSTVLPDGVTANDRGGDGPLLAAGPELVGLLPAGGPAPPESTPLLPTDRLVGYRVKTPFDASYLYLAIVAVALIALGAGQIARYQGVKTSWKS